MNNNLIISSAQEMSAFNLLMDGVRDGAKKLKGLETPKSQTHKRKAKGGGIWIYAKSNYFEDLLDEHYPGWSFESDGEYKIIGREQSGFVTQPVKLTIIDNAIKRTICDVGGATIKYYSETNPNAGDYLDLPNDIKSAFTDGFKRCCYRLSMARDLKYDPSDLNITEEQNGLINWLLEHAKKETKDKIRQIVEQNINRSNFDDFVKNQLMPKIKKWPDKYERLVKMYGEPTDA